MIIQKNQTNRSISQYAIYFLLFHSPFFLINDYVFESIIDHRFISRNFSYEVSINKVSMWNTSKYFIFVFFQFIFFTHHSLEFDIKNQERQSKGTKEDEEKGNSLLQNDLSSRVYRLENEDKCIRMILISIFPLFYISFL